MSSPLGNNTPKMTIDLNASMLEAGKRIQAAGAALMGGAKKAAKKIASKKKTVKKTKTAKKTTKKSKK